MLQRLTILFITCLFACSVLAQGPSFQDGQTRRVMIKYTGAGLVPFTNTITDLGGQIHRQFPSAARGLTAETIVAATLSEDAIATLEMDDRVIDIQNDPKRFLVSQDIPYGIDKIQARDVWDQDRDGQVDQCAPTGDGIIVGIVDTGLYVQHEDLKDVNVIGGYPDGWDTDGCGHGTHVAGTIAAVNNATGVVGVSPGDVSLYIVKAFNDSCSWAYASELIDAIKKCAENGADVISMSLSHTEYSGFEDEELAALWNQGVLLIAAAGNSGDTTTGYPASYDSVVSVGATDENDDIAWFSTYNEQVEVSAPGVGVVSTFPGQMTSMAKISVGGQRFSGLGVQRASLGVANGPVVDGGLCDGVSDWSGMVVFCQRGDNSFFDKVTNAQNGGAVGVVIYNNEEGGFLGSLGEGNSSTIPVISLSDESGENVLAIHRGVQSTLESSVAATPGSYTSYNGTSMATPHVSGAAAVLLSANPSYTNADVRNALNATALDLGDPGRDVFYGYGRIQMADALDYLGGTASCLNAAFTHATNGLTVDFDASASNSPDSPITSYAWDFGDGHSGSGQIVGHTYAASGTYAATLTITTANNQTSTRTADVTVGSQAPNASFSATVHGDTVDFDAGASSDPDGTIVSYSWNFGDGDTGSGQTTSHLYASAGTFTATLTVTDNHGQTNATSQNVVIAGGGNQLSNGVPVNGLSGASGDQLAFVATVPEGITRLTIAINGGSGDADLYVKYGQPATTNNWDYRPYDYGNDEVVLVTDPAAGEWHVMLNGSSSFSDVTLTASWDQASSQVFTGTIAPQATNNHSITVGAGVLDLILDWDNNADLDVRLYDANGQVAASTTLSKPETLSYNASAGTYTIEVFNYNSSGDNANYTVTVNHP